MSQKSKKKAKSNYRRKASKASSRASSIPVKKKTVDEYLSFRAVSTEDGTILCTEGPGGLLSSRQAVGPLTHVREYQRASGKPKVLTKMHFIGGRAHTDLLRAVKSNYDVLACVDTNSVRYKGVELKVTAAFCSGVVLSPDLDTVTLDACRFTVFHNVKSAINPEVIGWHLFIAGILPGLNLPERRNVCLVVDSELDAHERINARKVPYYSNFYLPEGVDLLYASADSAGHAFNKIMKLCDRKCTEVCQQIADGKFPFPDLVSSGDKDFDICAYINLNA